MIGLAERVCSQTESEHLVRLTRIALIGNALPRRCGLATYTSHVFDALRDRFPELVIDHYAMNDPGQTYPYPRSVTGILRQEEISDYLGTAERIGASGAELVWVQHEFGIFGGRSGLHLLALLERLTVPIVVTLHSVVDCPSKEQRAVMERLVRCSSKLIVMAEKGRAILSKTYGVRDREISVIPHGVPDRPFAAPTVAKPIFDLAGKKVLLTFGLLSPSKGIETMIEAMPAILDVHPDTIYVVAGLTHPHLVAHEGERYRTDLVSLADRLGVRAHVRWIDRFLDQKELLDLIAAADIYITPYLDLKQITSGALSYAVALGKPVVSTPYHHAAEIIGPANGILANPGDIAGFARAVLTLLDDDRLRDGMARCAYALGRPMIWSRNAEAAMVEFSACLALAQVRTRLPLPSLNLAPTQRAGALAG